MKKKEKSGWKEKSAETGKKLQNFVTERSLWQQDITFKERGAAGGKAAALIGITAWLYYRKIWAVPALIPLGLWLYREFLKEEEKKKKKGKHEKIMDEWDELQEEERLYRLFKKNKLRLK